MTGERFSDNAHSLSGLAIQAAASDRDFAYEHGCVNTPAYTSSNEIGTDSG